MTFPSSLRHWANFSPLSDLSGKMKKWEVCFGLGQVWNQVLSVCCVMFCLFNFILSDLLARGCQHIFEATSKYTPSKTEMMWLLVNDIDVIFVSSFPGIFNSIMVSQQSSTVRSCDLFKKQKGSLYFNKSYTSMKYVPQSKYVLGICP